MSYYNVLSYPPQEATLDMKFQVYAETDLEDEEEIEPERELRMGVRGELSSLMCMSKEVPANCETGGCYLDWHMPP
jgi:hypothetical protein